MNQVLIELVRREVRSLVNFHRPDLRNDSIGAFCYQIQKKREKLHENSELMKYFKKMYTYCFVLFSWLVHEMDPSCRQYSRYNYLKVFLEN